jgi:subtilisin family serine protease
MPCVPVRPRLLHAFALAALLTVLAHAVPAAAAAPGIVRPLPSVSSFVGNKPDEFVVVFQRATAHQLEALPSQAGRPRANLERVQAVLDRVAAGGFEREFASAKPQAIGSRFPDLIGHYLVSLLPGMDLDAAIAAFAAMPEVDHVEKIGIHTVDLTPNDKYYLNENPPAGFPWKQWHYWDTYGMGASTAWDTERGSANVAVGIIDTGMRYFHSDLGGSDPPGPADNVTNGNVWVNAGEIPGNGIDDDGNGFVDDVIGYDFVSGVLAGTTCRDPDCGTPDNDPMDGEGHGTHVGGTVGAITNNGNRVAGIGGGWGDGTPTGAANGVRLIPLRIGYHCRVSGQLTGVVAMDWAAQAMNYVAGLVDEGVDVTAVNCSWGSSNSGGIAAAVANLQAHDVLVVCAAGNSNLTANAANGNYLCEIPGVLAVGATDSLGVGASFSSFGPNVDLAAPGVHVLSTYSPNQDDGVADGDYVALLDGTSMASPHVVGAAAVLESYDPSLTAAQKAALLTGHTKAFAAGNTKALGTGILDLAAALAATPVPTTGVGDSPFTNGPAIELRAFPNPVRGGSELTVHLRAGERVELRILDASGRTVRAMGAVADASGAARLRWDGRGANGRRARPGLYLVSATSGAQHVTHKLVVLE